MDLATFLRTQALKIALKSGKVLEVIPRTLPKAAGVNVFVVQIGTHDRDWFFLADKAIESGLSGRYWNDDNSLLPASMQHASLGEYLIEFTHYIGIYEFKYVSALKFLSHEIFRIPYLYILWDKLNQTIFNRRQLIRKQRLEVLRLITERSIADSNYQISYISLMNFLYSPRWVFHPEKEKMSRYCRLILDSLVVSGEVTSANGTYKIHAKALATLTESEEEDRRHRDMVNQQAHLKWLTVALVVVGIAQALITWLKP